MMTGSRTNLSSFAFRSRLAVLDLLPIADPVGDQTQERLSLGDGVEQAGLPEMPMPQMRLIDEHVGAGQCGLDRLLQGECDGAVGRVIAQEDAQRSRHRAAAIVP